MLEHERHVLACGTVVLVRPQRFNDIVAIRAFLPMGSLYESENEAGVSSLLQSVITRGTQSHSAHALQDALADLGAELDAGSGPDLGTVNLRATSLGWEAALDLFAETLTEPAFDADEVATEVEQHLGAIQARDDQLLARVFDLFRAQFFGDHPYRKPVLGYRDAVSGLGRDEVVEAARRFYRPWPPVISAVGRFDPDKLIKRLDTALGPRALESPLERPSPPSPAGGENRLELDREAAYLVHGYPAPAIVDDDFPVALLVDSILGGSMASRLFVELREKKSLGYQVSSLYERHVDGSFIAAYIVTDPGRVDQAATGLENEFQRLIKEPVPEAELAAARQYLRGSFLIASERNAAQAARLGRYEVHGLGQDFGDRWMTALESIDPTDVSTFAKRYFERSATRALIVPKRTGGA